MKLLYLILLTAVLFIQGCARVSYPMMDPRDNQPDVMVPRGHVYVPLGYGYYGGRTYYHRH